LSNLRQAGWAQTIMILLNNFLILRIVHGEISTPASGKTAIKPLSTSFTNFRIHSAHCPFPESSSKEHDHRRAQYKHNFYAFINRSKNIAGDATNLPGNPPHVTTAATGPKRTPTPMLMTIEATTTSTDELLRINEAAKPSTRG